MLTGGHASGGVRVRRLCPPYKFRSGTDCIPCDDLAIERNHVEAERRLHHEAVVIGRDALLEFAPLRVFDRHEAVIGFSFARLEEHLAQSGCALIPARLTTS